MRIVFLNNYYYLRGGSERVFFAEMELMKERGHETIGFARRRAEDLPSPYAGYFPPDIETEKMSISMRALRTASQLIRSGEAREKLRTLIRRTRPDVAHAHNIYGRLTTSVLDCLQEERVPAVMTLHDYKLACPAYNFTYKNSVCEDCKVHRYYRCVLKRCHKGNYAASAIYALESYYNWLFRKYENKVGAFIAPSRFLRNKLTVDYGWPAEKIRYVPNFIDCPGYRHQEKPGDYFLYLGRLSDEKGVSTLIEAFKSLKYAKTALVIAGDGPLRRHLEEISRPDKRIRFVGYLAGEALRELTARARAIVLPSVCYENAPISILEAMASGRPVIGANIGGIPEMINEGETGFLFAPGDVQSLAGKMEFLLSLPDESVVKMGEAAREKAEKEFNVESHYERILCIYREVLGVR